MREVAEEAKSHGIKFYIIEDEPTKLASLVNENNIGALITDFSPLREFKRHKRILRARFPADVPVIQVDTHNVVPVWIASPQEESSPKTFRPKVTGFYHRYLTDFPIPTYFETAGILVDNNREMVCEKHNFSIKLDQKLLFN